MKFSDMMGPGEDSATDVEEDAPPAAPAARTAPPLPEAPVQLGGNRSQPPDDDPAPAVPAAEASVAPPVIADPPAPLEVAQPAARSHEPLLSDVVAELAPRADFTSRTGASDEQLDATAWLEGLNTIDDDLLPR